MIVSPSVPAAGNVESPRHGVIAERPAIMPGITRTRPRLTLDAIWLVLPPLVLLVILNLQTINPNDFWWHIRTGQIILQTHGIPNVDLFTFSRQGSPWLNQSWLTEVLFYLAYRSGGPALVVFVYALMMAAGYTLLELACLVTAGGRVRVAAIATAVAVILGLTTWTVRPQATSFAIFGLILLILEDQRLGQGRHVYWLPALFALWTNLHGGFIFGIGLVGVYLLVRLGSDLYERHLSTGTRRLLVATIASILALALNPSGLYGIVGYVIGFFQSSATQDLNLEFLPLTIREGDGIFFVAAIVLFLAVLYIRRRRLPLHHFVMMLVFGLVALHSRRALPWFGMAAAPAVAWLILPEGPAIGANAPQRERAGMNYLLAAFIAVFVVGSLPWFRPYLWMVPTDRRVYVTAESTPVQAVSRLCQLGEGQRVFSEISYASYLAWACPTAPFFMDTRFELYPRSMWNDYLLISFGQFGWDDTLRKYGVTTILARKSSQNVLITALKDSSNWQILYEDEYVVLAGR